MAIGTQYDRDTAGSDGFYNWDCVGINTPSTEACQATNLAATPVCKSYAGTYAAEPASNDATGCDRGSFANADDSIDTWRWTCRNNNTGASTNCSAAKPVPVVNFSGNPTTVVLGQTVTLTWSTQYAASCTSSMAWGSAGKPVNGSETVTPSPTGTRTYRLTCSNGSGSTVRDVTITVTAPPTPTPAPTPAPTPTPTPAATPPTDSGADPDAGANVAAERRNQLVRWRWHNGNSLTIGDKDASDCATGTAQYKCVNGVISNTPDSKSCSAVSPCSQQ